MINQDKKCMRVCGINVANILAVGLLSSLIGTGIAYFVLVRSADFQWWWLLALFGVQFILVIVVAYALQKTSGLNNMFAEAPALMAVNYDWSNLRMTLDAAPKIVSSDSALSGNNEIDSNSANWQDLLQQLDQMSKSSVVEKVIASDVIYPAAANISLPPSEEPMFNFASIASALATPAPVVVTPKTSAPTPTPTPVPIKAVTATLAPPVSDKPVTVSIESPGSGLGIDFAALFR